MHSAPSKHVRLSALGEAVHTESRIWCCNHAASIEFHQACRLLQTLFPLRLLDARCCHLSPADIYIRRCKQDNWGDNVALRVQPGSSGAVFKQQLESLVGSSISSADDTKLIFDVVTATGAGFQLSGMASYGVASYCAALAQLLDARRSKPSAQPLQLQRGTNPASLNGGGCNVDEQAADSGSCDATGSAANTAPCVRVIVRMRAADSGAAWPLAPAVQGWLHTVAHAELELEGSDAGGITSSVEDTLREEALSIMRWCPGGTANRCNNQLLKMLGLSASVDSLRLPTPETDRECDPYGLMSPSGEQESVFGISDETAAEVVDPTWETQAVGGFEFRFVQLGSPAEVTSTGVQSLSLMGSGDALYAAMSAAVSQKPRQLLAVQLLKRQQQRAQTLKHLQRHKRKEHMSQQELQCPRLRRAEVEVLNLADYPLLPQYCPRPYIGDYSISFITTLDWNDDNLIAPQLDGDGCHLSTDILSIFLGDIDDNAVKGMAPSPEVREVDWTRVARYGSVAHMLERCGATGTSQAGWVCPCPACRGSRAGGDATGSCGCGDGASYGCALEAGEMLLTSLTAGAVWL